MWMLVWQEADGTRREKRHWGTVAVEGQMVRLVHYSGGVAGLPHPMSERVVPLARLAEWRSDDR
jgi:hypothetical protein